MTATILEHEAGQHPRIPAAGHHRDVNGGWLRPAVFGAMDGLVSNFALMTGVVGGAVPSSTVVLTGLAGLAAGACSMAAGSTPRWPPSGSWCRPRSRRSGWS